MKKNYACGTPLWRCLKKTANPINIRGMLIFVCLIHFSVLYSQNNGFTIKLKNVELEKVFDQIKTQSDYTFFYDNEGISKIKNVSIDVKNASIDEVMEQLLKSTPYAYKIVDKTIILFLKEKRKKADDSQTNNTYAVSGKVLDEDGDPLPGATVLIKGTTKGTTTNVDGNYTLKVPKGTVLLFSFIGFHKQEIAVSAEDSEINVVMEQKAAELGEFTVISTGYQLIKPEQSTGSVATMRAKEYDSRINTTDFLTSLENRIPGLLINKDVEFEGNSLFQIRGISTINGGKEPLIVVDGYPTELSLDMINPNEIESVTVLKDAAAATVYGARSSNGVIVIERKKAKAGKINVDFRATTGFKPKENYDRYRWDEDASNIYIDYYRLTNTAFPYMWTLMNSIYSGNSFNLPAPAYIMAQLTDNVIDSTQAEQQFRELGSYNNAKDYARLFLRTATTQTYNLNLSGGNEDALYYITANYTDYNASQIKNGNSRFQLSGRTMLNFSNRFSLDLTTDFQEAKENSVSIPSIASIFSYERFEDGEGNPLPIYYNSNANPYYNKALMELGLLDNMYYPLVEINEVNDKTRTVNNRITANFRYDIGKGINFNFGGVYETSRTEIKHFASENSSEVHQYVNYYTQDDGKGGFIFNFPKGDFLKESQRTKQSYTIRAQLNYDKQLDNDHSLNLIFGGEIRKVLTKSSSTAYLGYSDQTLLLQAVDYKSLSKFSGKYAQSNSSILYDISWLYNQGYRDDRYLSAYSNVVYAYKGKYSFTGSIRIDQSNLFGTDPKYKYKPLWSLGAAWNIHKEEFMQNIDWLKSLKLRMAYGFNGNVAKEALPEVIAWAKYNYVFLNTIPSLRLLSHANSGLRWEQTRNFNIGLDYTIFKNITGSIDYYNKKSTDLLANNQIDASKGGSYALINQASIRNTGLEVTLHADWITRKIFNWNTGLVLSHNSSKVLGIFNSHLTTESEADDYFTGSYSDYIEGYAIGAKFNYRYAGLDSEGAILVYNENGEPEEFSYSLDKTYLDYAGSSIPTVTIGLSNRVDIGNFYAYCMINFYGGFKVSVPPPFAGDLRPLEGADNYWREAGDEEDPGVLPSPLNGYTSNLRYTDKYTVSGAYFTLADLTASYSFRNSKLVEKIGLSNLELRMQASNLFTVGLNKFNYSVATGSYAKSYLTPTYTVGLYVNF